MAELADAIDLGSISKEWEFKSLHPHQIRRKSLTGLAPFLYEKFALIFTESFP